MSPQLWSWHSSVNCQRICPTFFYLVKKLVKEGKVKFLLLVHCDQLQQPMDSNLSQRWFIWTGLILVLAANIVQKYSVNISLFIHVLKCHMQRQQILLATAHLTYARFHDILPWFAGFNLRERIARQGSNNGQICCHVGGEQLSPHLSRVTWFLIFVTFSHI